MSECHAAAPATPPTSDYFSWHDEYAQPGSPLHLRLVVVRDLIASAFDALPPGPIRIVSMCAGQGLDVLPAVHRHRRGAEIGGRLVELDPGNVAVARQTIDVLGLRGIEVVRGDAGVSDAYVGAASSDLVLACGIFGNIADEDVERTVSFLPAICSPGAWVIWTRYPRNDAIIPTIRQWFSRAGFESVVSVVPEVPMFGVAAARFAGRPTPLRPGLRLFGDLR